MSIPKSCAKWLALILVSLFTACAYAQAPGPAQKPGTAVATFAGGCFWCMEPPYDKLPGVISTTSGYVGGKTKNPTYEQVSTGATGHAEVVQVQYDPARVSYATSGRTRTVRAGGRTVALKHSRTPVLDAPEPVNAIVQALAHLGKGNIDTDAIGRFAARLDDAGTRALVAARPAMPGWMGDIVLKIQAARDDLSR